MHEARNIGSMWVASDHARFTNRRLVSSRRVDVDEVNRALVEVRSS